MRATRHLVRGLLAAGLALGGGVLATTPASAAGCSGTSGVTVVVGSTVRCAPGDPTSGIAALQAAGFSVTRVARFPAAVCRIDGAPAADDCVNMPPTSAYWSYWHAKPGGSWTYANVGGGAYDPAPGTVEGWAFGSGSPPPIAPPAGPVPKPTATPRPSTSSPRPTVPKPRPSTSSARPSVPVTGNSTGPGTRTSSSTAAPSPQGTTSAPTSLPTTVTTSAAASATSGSPSAPGTTTAPDGQVLGLPAPADAGADRTSPWPLVGGFVLLLGLGGAAAVARRSRSAH